MGQLAGDIALVLLSLAATPLFGLQSAAVLVSCSSGYLACALGQARYGLHRTALMRACACIAGGAGLAICRWLGLGLTVPCALLLGAGLAPRSSQSDNHVWSGGSQRQLARALACGVGLALDANAFSVLAWPGLQPWLAGSPDARAALVVVPVEVATVVVFLRTGHRDGPQAGQAHEPPWQGRLFAAAVSCLAAGITILAALGVNHTLMRPLLLASLVAWPLALAGHLGAWSGKGLPKGFSVMAPGGGTLLAGLLMAPEGLYGGSLYSIGYQYAPMTPLGVTLAVASAACLLWRGEGHGACSGAPEPTARASASPAPDLEGLLHGLSPRERQAAEGILAGESLQETAVRLGIAQGTLSTYRSRALRKIGVSRAAELVALAEGRGQAGELGVSSDGASAADAGRAVGGHSGERAYAPPHLLAAVALVLSATVGVRWLALLRLGVASPAAGFHEVGLDAFAPLSCAAAMVAMAAPRQASDHQPATWAVTWMSVAVAWVSLVLEWACVLRGSALLAGMGWAVRLAGGAAAGHALACGTGCHETDVPRRRVPLPRAYALLSAGSALAAYLCSWEGAGPWLRVGLWAALAAAILLVCSLIAQGEWEPAACVPLLVGSTLGQAATLGLPALAGAWSVPLALLSVACLAAGVADARRDARLVASSGEAAGQLWGAESPATAPPQDGARGQSGVAPEAGAGPSPEARLTPAEREVCLMLARGLGAAQIAEERCCSVDTVRSHRRSIYKKLGVHSQRELIERLAASGGTASLGDLSVFGAVTTSCSGTAGRK